VRLNNPLVTLESKVSHRVPPMNYTLCRIDSLTLFKGVNAVCALREVTAVPFDKISKKLENLKP
jgi:hypothetical protein